MDHFVSSEGCIVLGWIEKFLRWKKDLRFPWCIYPCVSSALFQKLILISRPRTYPSSLEPYSHVPSTEPRNNPVRFRPYILASHMFWIHLNVILYRVSQGECARLREGVPYVKVYRYNPKHLCPKLNGYGDNGQKSLKLWQLLHTYWLPNTY